MSIGFKQTKIVFQPTPRVKPPTEQTNLITGTKKTFKDTYETTSSLANLPQIPSTIQQVNSESKSDLLLKFRSKNFSLGNHTNFADLKTASQSTFVKFKDNWQEDNQIKLKIMMKNKK